MQCRAIVPNGSARRASGGVFRLFGLFVLLSAVALGSDRLGTIDLPCRRASGVVIQCRAIVPNGSARRASGGVFRLFGLFCLAVCGGFQVPIDWGQSIYHADYLPMQNRLNKASRTSLLATVPATWPSSSSAKRSSPATNSSPARSILVCLA